MREAHARARGVLEQRMDQMETMAKVLLARETVEGEAVDALLENRWDEYLAAHPEESAEGEAPGDEAGQEGEAAKADDAAIEQEAASYAQERTAAEGDADGGKPAD